MITSDEIRRSAARNGVDPMVIDHDYAIGCFLAFLGSEAMVKNNWVFKGGTALAKCYFGNYRFSEDPDFTLTSPMNQDQIIQTVLRAARKMEEVIGIRTTVRDVTSEIIRDAYGKESYEVRSYYEGVWYARGAPRSIRIHLNRDEVLAFPPASNDSCISTLTANCWQRRISSHTLWKKFLSRNSERFRDKDDLQ